MDVSLVEYEAARGKNAHPTNTVKDCKYNEHVNTFPGRNFVVANVNSSSKQRRTWNKKGN